MVVAKLHAAEKTSQRLVRIRCNRVCKAVICVPAAVPQVPADIEPGPIEDGLNVRSFGRHTNRNVRCRRGAIEHEQAKPGACECTLPGSAAAVHGVDIFSAS